MNCKEGDLAVFVRSKAGNEGKVVTCIRLATVEDCHKHGYMFKVNLWVTDTLAKDIHGGYANFANDYNLKPIRGTEGQDETLSWCDVPSKEVA